MIFQEIWFNATQSDPHIIKACKINNIRHVLLRAISGIFRSFRRRQKPSLTLQTSRPLRMRCGECHRDGASKSCLERNVIKILNDDWEKIQVCRSVDVWRATNIANASNDGCGGDSTGAARTSLHSKFRTCNRKREFSHAIVIRNNNKSKRKTCKPESQRGPDMVTFQTLADSDIPAAMSQKRNCKRR